MSRPAFKFLITLVFCFFFGAPPLQAEPLDVPSSEEVAEAERKIYEWLAHFNENEVVVLGAMTDRLVEECSHLEPEEAEPCVREAAKRINNPYVIEEVARDKRVPYKTYDFEVVGEGDEWKQKTFLLPDGRKIARGRIYKPTTSGYQMHSCPPWNPQACNNCPLCADVGRIIKGAGQIIGGAISENWLTVAKGINNVVKGIKA